MSDDWRVAPRAVAVRWRAAASAPEETAEHRQLSTAFERIRRLFNWSGIDLMAGGWLELSWPGVVLLVDVSGAREVEE